MPPQEQPDAESSFVACANDSCAELQAYQLAYEIYYVVKESQPIVVSVNRSGNEAATVLDCTGHAFPSGRSSCSFPGEFRLECDRGDYQDGTYVFELDPP